MKTKTLVLAVTFGSILGFAQTPSPVPPTPTLPQGTVISPFGRTNNFNLGGVSITNSLGQTFSQEEIESQLVQLRTSVEQALPALNAVSEVYSNSTAGTGLVGGIAELLGRSTNNVTGQTSTNTLGRILREAILAATTNATSTNLTQLQELALLQLHMQATTPIFDRLGISTNAMIRPGFGGTENSSRTNTGSGKGPGRRDNNNKTDNK